MSYYIHQLSQGVAYVDREPGGFGPFPYNETARALCKNIGVRIVDKPDYVDKDPRKIEEEEDGSNEKN